MHDSCMDINYYGMVFKTLSGRANNNYNRSTPDCSHKTSHLQYISLHCDPGTAAAIYIALYKAIINKQRIDVINTAIMTKTKISSILL